MGSTSNFGFMIKPEFTLNKNWRLTGKLSLPYGKNFDSGFSDNQLGVQKLFVETNVGFRRKLIHWKKQRNRKINLGFGPSVVYVGRVPLYRSHQIDLVGGVDYFQTGFANSSWVSRDARVTATQSSSVFLGLNYETLMNYKMTVNGKSGLILRSIKMYFYSKGVFNSEGNFYNFSEDVDYTSDKVENNLAFRGGVQFRMVKFKSKIRHHLMVMYVEYGTFPSYAYYPKPLDATIGQFGFAYVFSGKSINK